MRLRITILAAIAALLLTFAAPAQALELSRLIAPTSACPAQTDLEAPRVVQEEAMRCMTNFARHAVRRGSLADAGSLGVSAAEKSSDIIRCDNFSHFACDRDFTYWMRRAGYLPGGYWRAAENIAWGTGSMGTVRSIFTAWIHSPGHRENILGSYREIGIGLKVGPLQGHDEAHVWTQHFGSHR